MTGGGTLIVGVGSPRGDDRAGWLIADELASSVSRPNIAIRKALSPIDILDWLDGIDRLMICDACHGLGRVGHIGRWSWPTGEFSGIGWSGTHDLGLPSVLALADRLGRLPRRVVLWAVEGELPSVSMGGELSFELSAALSDVVARIIEELG